MNIAVVDRIEGDKVVLILNDKELIKPLTLFGYEVKEGQMINIENLELVSQKEFDRRKQEVKNKLARLFDK